MWAKNFLPHKINRDRDLAQWLERLTDNAEVYNCPGFDSSILRHSGIWGAADEATSNLTIISNPLKKLQNNSGEKSYQHFCLLLFWPITFVEWSFSQIFYSVSQISQRLLYIDPPLCRGWSQKIWRQQESVLLFHLFPLRLRKPSTMSLTDTFWRRD